jgi:hypothetical protein
MGGNCTDTFFEYSLVSLEVDLVVTFSWTRLAVLLASPWQGIVISRTQPFGEVRTGSHADSLTVPLRPLLAVTELCAALQTFSCAKRLQIP